MLAGVVLLAILAGGAAGFVMAWLARREPARARSAVSPAVRLREDRRRRDLLAEQPPEARRLAPGRDRLQPAPQERLALGVDERRTSATAGAR